MANGYSLLCAKCNICALDSHEVMASTLLWLNGFLPKSESNFKVTDFFSKSLCYHARMLSSADSNDDKGLSLHYIHVSNHNTQK